MGCKPEVPNSTKADFVGSPAVYGGEDVTLSGIAEIETIAGGLYAATQLAVLGVAAYTYNETESLLVPALAYASLLLANRTVVFVFEAGMQNW